MRIGWGVTLAAVAFLGTAETVRADTDYGPLKRVGVSAGAARLGRMATLQLTVTLRARTELRFALVDGDELVARAKTTRGPGRHRLRLRLRGEEPRPGLRLRITAKDVRTGRRARGRRKFSIPNRAPSDVLLSAAPVPENAPGGTVAGTVSAVDADRWQSHTFALLSPGPLSLSGATLATTGPLDFETTPSVTVEVRATDPKGASVVRALTVAVADVNEAPGPPALSNAAVDENQPAGTAVGTLSAVDPDRGDTLTFALTDRADVDNALFAIDGTTLRTAAELDHEERSTRTVRVRVTDARGATAEATFTIIVRDEVEPG